MGLIDASRERTMVDQSLHQLGFTVVVAEDSTARPMQMAWYQAHWAGRTACATVVRRKMRTHNTGMGNRHANAICLQLSLETQLEAPLGFGVLHQLSMRPAPSVAEAFPPDGPGFELSPAAKDAFVRFIQPLPGDRPSNGRHLRFVDRASLADYLPPTIHPAAQVLVMHTIIISEPLADAVKRDLDQMAWVAWSLETGLEMPAG